MKKKTVRQVRCVVSRPCKLTLRPIPRGWARATLAEIERTASQPRHNDGGLPRLLHQLHQRLHNNTGEEQRPRASHFTKSNGSLLASWQQPTNGNRIWRQAWLACLYIVPSIIAPSNCRGQPIVLPSGEATECASGRWAWVGGWKQEGQKSATRRKRDNRGRKHELNEQDKEGRGMEKLHRDREACME